LGSIYILIKLHFVVAALIESKFKILVFKESI